MRKMKLIALKDVCKINMGQSPNSSSYNDYGDGMPFFQGNADFGERYPITRVWCNTPTKIAQAEDILISVRAPIGALNYAKEECCIGRGLAAITPDRNKVSQDFIYWALKGKKAELNDKGNGSTFKAISRKILEETMIPDINFEQQHKCAENLEKIYGIIQNRRKELLALDDLIKARFVEMFGDAVANPMNWPIKELKDLSVQINSGNTPKGGSENYVEEGIAFFRSQNVWKDCLKMDDIAYIDEETHAKMKRSSLKQGDILMTKTGRINTENSSLGRAALYMGEDDMANVNGHVYFIRLKPEVNNKFVLRILVSDEYRDLIRSVCVGGIDKRQLNKEHIEDFPIICPPDYMVDKYVSFVEQVDKSKVAVQKALDETQTLFDSLMQEYFG